MQIETTKVYASDIEFSQVLSSILKRNGMQIKTLSLEEDGNRHAIQFRTRSCVGTIYTANGEVAHISAVDTP